MGLEARPGSFIYTRSVNASVGPAKAAKVRLTAALPPHCEHPASHNIFAWYARSACPNIC
jgi:hypothetical protein